MIPISNSIIHKPFMFFSFQRPLESSLKLVFSIPNGEFWKFFVIQHSFLAHSLHARFPSIHILGTIFAIIGKVFFIVNPLPWQPSYGTNRSNRSPKILQHEFWKRKWRNFINVHTYLHGNYFAKFDCYHSFDPLMMEVFALKNLSYVNCQWEIFPNNC